MPCVIVQYFFKTADCLRVKCAVLVNVKQRADVRLKDVDHTGLFREFFFSKCSSLMARLGTWNFSHGNMSWGFKLGWKRGCTVA